MNLEERCIQNLFRLSAFDEEDDIDPAEWDEEYVRMKIERVLSDSDLIYDFKDIIESFMQNGECVPFLPMIVSIFKERVIASNRVLADLVDFDPAEVGEEDYDTLLEKMETAKKARELYAGNTDALRILAKILDGYLHLPEEEYPLEASAQYLEFLFLNDTHLLLFLNFLKNISMDYQDGVTNYERVDALYSFLANNDVFRNDPERQQRVLQMVKNNDPRITKEYLKYHLAEIRNKFQARPFRGPRQRLERDFQNALKAYGDILIAEENSLQYDEPIINLVLRDAIDHPFSLSLHHVEQFFRNLKNNDQFHYSFQLYKELFGIFWDRLPDEEKEEMVLSRHKKDLIKLLPLEKIKRFLPKELTEITTEELWDKITTFVSKHTRMDKNQLKLLQKLTLEMESRVYVRSFYNLDDISMDNCFNDIDYITQESFTEDQILYRASVDPSQNKGHCYIEVDWNWFKDHPRPLHNGEFSMKDRVKIMMIYSKIYKTLK